MRIHYLQHVPFENPGTILDWAKQREYPLTCTKLYENSEFPEQSQFDWLVIMGGPMNIYEEEIFPWLVQEKTFIKETIENNKVVIGLCLGSQLIADVIGGSVIQNKDKEIGWFPITLTEEARTTHQFSFFPEHPIVFHWHGDTFTDLPEEAVLLATNEACRNQAFLYKGRVFGFQFHLENTYTMINDLIKNCSDDMKPGLYVQSAEDILAGSTYMEQDIQWMNLFLSSLDI
ncbi:MAG: putative amidotransferase [Herbinix sp.]|jgi:GMP synthase-like glutamine amidotransferase|nr:putative amidotransferase [Herbinix sp.]